MQPGQSVSPGGAQENPTWQFNPEAGIPAPQPQAPQQVPAPQPAAPASQAPPADADITWTASEFIAHTKSAGWYGLLGVGAVVIAAGIFLLTRDRISSAVIVVVAIIFGVAAARKPRELEYSLSNKGISIGGKPYPFSGFRSFAVVQEGGVDAIWFMPLKRFQPIVSIYFDPNDGDKIVDILSQALPIENKEPDPVDRLMHRIRF